MHSGDSVGVFPPRSVSEGDQDLIVTTMERIVLALGATGLVNAQFIVREDGVYLIEVNPRASRTVPFMSKVTGVPMVELAVRISLGETLADMGWPNGLLPPPPFIAVKAPAFSTAKLRGVDPSVGPGMQSTGEVIGIHTDPRVALAKALLGAALVPPRPGEEGALALLSIAERDKAELPRLGAALAAAGYRLAATAGTRAALAAAGFEAAPVAKLGEEPAAGSDEVAILELIANGEVRLVVNTPTPRSGAVRDAAEIRHAATAEGILCLTAIETAVAAAEALDPADRRSAVGGPIPRRVGSRRATARRPSGRGRRRVTDAFELIIFDCDGVLVDSERLSIQVDAVYLERLGWPMPAGRDRRAVRRPIRRRHAGRDRGAHRRPDPAGNRGGVLPALSRDARSGADAGGRDPRSARSHPDAALRRVERQARNNPAEPRADRADRLFRGADLQRNRRGARQARAGSVSVRGCEPRRGAVPVRRRRGQRPWSRGRARGRDAAVCLRRWRHAGRAPGPSRRGGLHATCGSSQG